VALWPPPARVRMQKAQLPPLTAEVLFMDIWNLLQGSIKPLDLILIAGGAVVAIPLIFFYLQARAKKAKKKGKAKSKE
jgi:hypothetical protein